MPLVFAVVTVAASQADITTAILRIQDFVSKGESDAAQHSLDRAMKQWPNDAGLYNLQGIVHANAQDFPAAQTDFEHAVTLNPSLAPAWKNLARIYERDGDSRAETADLTVLKLAPHDAEARLQLARLLEWRGAFAESLGQLDQLGPKDSEVTEVMALRAGSLAGLGRATEAASWAVKLEGSPALQERDILAILPVVETKQPALALELIKKLDARHLATDDSRHHLGTIYENLGELAKAREAFEGVARAQGVHAADLLSLARVAYKQHQIDDALGYVAHARDLEPDNAAVHFFFGMLAVEKNLPLEARKSLETAVRLSPDQAYYNYALGAVALQGHAPSDAIPFLQKYVRLTAGDPRGRFALGTAYFNIGDYAKARAEFDVVANATETRGGANYFLGRLDKLDGDYAQAAAHLERSIQATPAYADAHAELGLVRIRMSRFEDASKELEQALRLEPSNPAANRNLLILYQRTQDARAAAQAARVKEIEAQREQNVNLLFRNIQVRPY